MMQAIGPESVPGVWGDLLVHLKEWTVCNPEFARLTVVASVAAAIIILLGRWYGD